MEGVLEWFSKEGDIYWSYHPHTHYTHTLAKNWGMVQAIIPSVGAEKIVLLPP